MTFIKNRRAWLRWRRTDTTSQDEVSEPKEFPCMVYLTTLSFGYEESRANYLYAEDVIRMWEKLCEMPVPKGDSGVSGG